MPTNRSSFAYERVRQMILDDELPPGATIKEVDLVRMVGVSRTPVRNALLRLESEGYVAHEVLRGLVVVELGPQDVIDVYEVRAMLEGPAAYAAATVISRATLGHLEDLYEAMEQARSAGDNRRLGRLNSEFHHAIAQASGNRYLETTLNNIYDVFERFRPVALVQPGRRDTAAQEHGELIAALRAGEAAKARSIAEHHVRRALVTRQQATEHPS